MPIGLRATAARKLFKTRVNVDDEVAKAAGKYASETDGHTRSALSQLIKGQVQTEIAERHERHAQPIEEGDAVNTVKNAIGEAHKNITQIKRSLGPTAFPILSTAPYIDLSRWRKTAETVSPHASEKALGQTTFNLAQRTHEHEGQMLRSGWSDRIAWPQLREVHGATDTALHEIASRELKLKPPQTVADAKAFNEKLAEARDKMWTTAHIIGNQGTKREPVDLKTVGLGERQGTLYDLIVRPAFWRAVAKTEEEPPRETAKWGEVTAWARKIRALMPGA